MTEKVKIKTEVEMKMMLEGGRMLAKIKKELGRAVKPGVTAMDIENLANKLINASGGKPSFKMVPGYSWATCINVNDGVVHGIPKKETVFKEGDIVSVDVGIYHKGFHTDTALTVYLGKDGKKMKFLDDVKGAMLDGVKEVKWGKKIGDISKAIEKRLKKADIRPIWSLTGHGVGKELHEGPTIPGFTTSEPSQDVIIKPGFVLAVEVMATTGSGEVKIDSDGWTLRTKDAKMAALFEETVAVTSHGPVVLTR